MKKKKLELYRDFLLLINYYKEKQNEYTMSREDVIKYLDNQTNQKFNIYESDNNAKIVQKLKVLSLYRNQ